MAAAHIKAIQVSSIIPYSWRIVVKKNPVINFRYNTVELLNFNVLCLPLLCVIQNPFHRQKTSNPILEHQQLTSALILFCGTKILFTLTDYAPDTNPQAPCTHTS